MKNIAELKLKKWPDRAQRSNLLTLIFLASLMFVGNAMAQTTCSYNGTSADLTCNLVSWWTLDDGTGATAVDSGSDGNNGSLGYPFTGVWAIGKAWEYALPFYSSSSMQVGNPSSYSFIQDTKTFTISAWVQLANYNASIDETIFGNSHNGYGAGVSLLYYNSDSSNSLLFFMTNASQNTMAYILVPGAITDNNWHQVVVTGDGTNAQMYLDGNPIGPLSPISGSASGSSLNALSFGYTSGFGDPFTGTLDDIRIYTSALPASDIKNLLFPFRGAGAPPTSTAKAPTTDFYVAQNWTGDGVGTNCDNAQNVAWFNSSGSWGTVAGQIGPGTTVHLCGNAIADSNGITNPYITSNLTVQGSGTSINPITIKFEPGTRMSQPAWANSVINVAGQSYIVIDGGAATGMGGYNGNPSLANGIIESTDNGTGPATCIPGTTTCGTYTYQNNAQGVGLISPGPNGPVNGSPATHITVQNLVIRNLYVRLGGSNDDGASGNAVSVSWNGSAGINTDWTVNNCIFHDMTAGFSIGYGPGSQNFTYSNSTAYDVDWGGNAGDSGTTGTMTNLVVENNYFHDFNPWNSPDNNFHENGFFAWAQNGGTLNDITYNGNVVTNFGTHNSSGLFIQGIGATGTYNFYNNLIIAIGNGPADGGIYVSDTGNGAHVNIYNNTLIGTGINFGEFNVPSTSFVNIENNIFTSGTAINIFDSSILNLTSNFNVFYDLSSWINPEGVSDGLQDQGLGYQTGPGADNSAFDTPSSWQAFGFDTNSQFNNPNLNANDVPQSPSPAIGNGVNLSSYFTTDINDNPRPATGPWDIGAYVSGSTTSTPTPNIAYGDVNGALNNGQPIVTIADAEMTAQAVVGLITLTPSQQQAAMVSSSTETKPTIYDAYLIAEYAVGLITQFPVQQ